MKKIEFPISLFFDAISEMKEASVKEIAKKVKCSYGTAENALKKLVENGKIKRKKKYGGIVYFIQFINSYY